MNPARLVVLVTADMLPKITPELLKSYENSGIEVRGVDVAAVAAERLPAALAEPTRVITTAPKPLHYEHEAWLPRKKQAQWKQEQGPQRRGKRGRR